MFRWLHSPPPAIRRLVTGLAVIAYLGSVWGYPLPGSGSVDLSTPFPCQGHRCGCQSADQCWHNCCCFTPAERLAWATAHGVTIPADVRETLLAAAGHASEPDDAAAQCCSRGTDHGDCQAHEHDDHESLACASEQCEHAADEADHHCVNCKSHASNADGWVLGIEARKCRGLSTEWIAGGASLPLQIVPLWEFDWAPAGHVLAGSSVLTSVPLTPAEPPPRA